MKRKRIISLIILAVVFYLYLQYPDDYPEVRTEVATSDLQYMPYANLEVSHLLTTACNDCHSYNVHETPWYGKLPIVKGWMASHMINGRKHLNFSEWANYKEEKQEHKLEEIAEMVSKKEMPLTSYLLGHSDARISKEERKMISDWAIESMNSYQ